MATFPNGAPSVGRQGIIIDDGDLTIARPVGALVYKSVNSFDQPLGLYRSVDAGTASYTMVSGGAVLLFSRSITVSSSPLAIPAVGILATDDVYVSVVTDDTGGTLGVVSGEVTGTGATGQVTITAANAVVNGDGRVNYMVVRSIAP